MSRYVVDASVGVKWFLPEVHDEAARRLLNANNVLIAPDLLFPEIGNILWKRVRNQELSAQQAADILDALGTMPIQIVPSWPRVLVALDIACRTQRTVYDSLYLALAVQEQAVMVTADEKFYNIIHAGPLAPFVCWVEDV